MSLNTSQPEEEEEEVYNRETCSFPPYPLTHGLKCQFGLWPTKQNGPINENEMSSRLTTTFPFK